MKKRSLYKLGAVVLVPLLFLTSACSQRYASTTSDTLKCVYDGSERGGQKLKFQVQPGAESKQIDDNDQTVDIPASNRFFMAALDDNVRDPLAPKFYEVFAARNTKVQIQGQVRFRFNLDNACEWYSKHGRRNASGNDLGFNKRGDEALSAGWFRFLTENFGTTMQQVASEQTGQFDPYAMVYNYPSNADDAGLVADGVTPAVATDLLVGDLLGKAFTDRLNANLGGQYFCGIDPDPNNATNTCPPMKFQVIAVHTSDPALEEGRSSVERTKNDLRNAELIAQLQQNQAAQIAAASEAQHQILTSKADAARLEAQSDPEVAKCLLYAEQGLACDGSRPPVIVNGQPQG